MDLWHWFLQRVSRVLDNANDMADYSKLGLSLDRNRSRSMEISTESVTTKISAFSEADIFSLLCRYLFITVQITSDMSSMQTLHSDMPRNSSRGCSVSSSVSRSRPPSRTVQLPPTWRNFSRKCRFFLHAQM